MSPSMKSSQEFTQLAKDTLVENGVTPSEALTQSVGKMLVRLEDLATAPAISDSSLSYEAVLRRCSLG